MATLRRLGGACAAILLALGSATAASADMDHPGDWGDAFWEGGPLVPDPWTKNQAELYPTAVSLVMLPDGRALYWNGLEALEKSQRVTDYAASDENARARLLHLGTSDAGDETWTRPHPETGAGDPEETTVLPLPEFAGDPDDSLFCADQKLLYDGTVLIAGGENRPDDIYGTKTTLVFDPATNRFEKNPPEEMDDERWYPSLITLADGRVLVASGARTVVLPTESSVVTDPGGVVGTDSEDVEWKNVKTSQIYDPATGSWQPGPTSDFSFPLYPRLHLLPGGRVLYNGAGAAWPPFAEDPDMAYAWGLRRVYEPGAGEWTPPPKGESHTRYGVRDYPMSVLLRFDKGAYDEAKILTAGGALGPQTSGQATTLSDITTIDADGTVKNDTPAKAPLAGMLGDETQLNGPRWQSTAVLLPTGEVLAFSGAKQSHLITPSLEMPVRTAELYDPGSNTWTELDPSPRARTYHGSAALLPDGRVLVGGHAPVYSFNIGDVTPAPGCKGYCWRDSTFEIYTPPYLQDNPSRPQIAKMEVQQEGERLRIKLAAGTTAEDIDDVVLVRLPATTHGLDSDQRAVALQFAPSSGTEALRARLPNGGDGSILPPGPYYVFVVDDDVPSVARTHIIRPAGDSKVLF